jgi:hypothetical protein
MLILTTGGAATAADWPEMRAVGPFICRADFSLSPLRPFLDELSGLQTELVQALDISPAREATEIYLFHDQPTYERYLKKYYPNVPFHRAVYIKAQGRGRVFAYRSAQLETDLRHECTHALLHASLSTIPLWLDEGLAGYFELPSDQRITGSRHIGTVRWNAWLGIVPNIEALEKYTDTAMMGKAEYRDCWAWVCFMLNGSPAMRQELIHYLYDGQNQQSPKPLSQRLGDRLPELQRSFVAFFRSGTAIRRQAG